MWVVTSLKICTLMCYFCRKYIMFEPKKYRRVMCHNTGKWGKIWRETALCFENWHEEFGEFWPNTPKSENLHFDRPFLTVSIQYNVWAKQELCVIILKIDSNFEGKMSCGFINYMRNLVVNFTRALKNFKICILRDFFAKEYNVEQQNYRGVICHDTEGWCNI